MSTKTKESLKIVSQEEIGTGIFSMWLQADRMAEAARPGQFLSSVHKERKQTASASDQYLRDRQRERKNPSCIPCDRQEHRNRGIFQTSSWNPG